MSSPNYLKVSYIKYRQIFFLVKSNNFDYPEELTNKFLRSLVKSRKIENYGIRGTTRLSENKSFVENQHPHEKMDVYDLT